MPRIRSIILAGLDDQSRQTVESCLSSDEFEITQLESGSGNEQQEQAHLVILRATTDDVRQVRELCDSLRTRFGRGVPLLACVGRYVFPTVRPLLGTELQGVIITPFDAAEFR
ncbi:MAG: hypothetical protein ACE5FP_05210, partial [Gemmatimonadota bacterium]